MTDWLLRCTAALLVTYAVSRLLRRAPLTIAEPRRSLIVHGCAALLVCAGVYMLRQAGAALVLPLMAQGGWLLLDLARGRGIMARAG